MIRYIYEIKNKNNGKTYIGQHSQRTREKEDTYMGSGKLLKEAYAKEGIENFEKNILVKGEFSKQEINALEKEYIRKYKARGGAEYNKRVSSIGGDTSSFIDYEIVGKSLREGYKLHPERGERCRQRCFKNIENGTYKLGARFGKDNGMYGRKHSLETREKLRETHIGEQNSQWGKHWYTNGEYDVSSYTCPEGFRRGRVLRRKED